MKLYPSGLILLASHAVLAANNNEVKSNLRKLQGNANGCGLAIGAERGNKGGNSIAHSHRSVALNMPKECGKASTVKVELPPGKGFKNFKKGRSYEIGSGEYWYGEDETDGSSFNFILGDDGTVTASLTDPTGAEVYQFSADADGEEFVTITRSSDFPPEGDPQEHEDDKGLFRSLVSVDVDLEEQSHRSLSDDGGVLDVLVLWTKKSECRNSDLAVGCAVTETTKNNMMGRINLAVQETNTAYTLSGVNTSLRLVHAYRHESYVEPGFDQALSALRATNDNVLDDAHCNRAKYGADLVALIIDDPAYCGLAYLGPSKDLMFSVTAWNCATGYYSFGHEIGHNMGCNHDRGTANACSNTFYGYGYRDPSAGFRSILAYNCASGQCDNNAGGGCTRVQRFSNPNFTYNNKAIGTATEDNARRINDVRQTIAAYYPANPAPSAECSMTLPPTPAPTPCPGSGMHIVINVVTDNYPSETSWSLTNECTTNVAANMPRGSYDSQNTAYNHDYCMPNESYKYQINDSYGDGICCSYGSGAYTIAVNGQVAASGGAFGSVATHSFGSCSTTSSPTKNPVTLSPTQRPVTSSPTKNPVSSSPTQSPVTSSPTQNPVTLSPTQNPTDAPVTSAPITAEPTNSPTLSPTSGPTNAPTNQPTNVPTDNPTSQPTNAPTSLPTNSPTSQPTDQPTSNPTSPPTAQPTDAPATSAPITAEPTNSPTLSPTNGPTNAPTNQPTDAPTSTPTNSPTSQPTDLPTSNPTSPPTALPTDAPVTSAPSTAEPTDSPTLPPTNGPTNAPTAQPTNAPTSNPTSQPTNAPTSLPTALTGYCTDGTGRCLPTNMSQCACTAMSDPAPKQTGSIFGRRILQANICANKKNNQCDPAFCVWAAGNCIPASAPTTQPTDAPTPSPTNAPMSSAPTSAPTHGPTNPPVSDAPSKAPTDAPTSQPSTGIPTGSPTPSPSNAPTTPLVCGCSITAMPTAAPMSAPTDEPTQNPTVPPTKSPTDQPTKAPIASTPNPTSQPVTGSPTAKCLDPGAECSPDTGCIVCCSECCNGIGAFDNGKKGLKYCSP